MTSYEAAFNKLMGNEGRYSNDPRDPGGETMWGVTLRVARAHGYMGCMIDMPRETASHIYYQLYWTPLKLDLFDPRVAFQIFDANVNGGHPIIWAQGSSGAKVDGLIGPDTTAHILRTHPLIFIMRFNALRLMYYVSLRQLWTTFGRGWVNRIASNLIYGALDRIGVDDTAAPIVPIQPPTA